MIQRLHESGKLTLTILLVVFSLFSFGLSIVHSYATSTRGFLFLNWNLFLAFLPWAATTYITLYSHTTKTLTLAILLGLWLLFFPNSPYILTDLFHLLDRGKSPMWFDLIMILSFAWTGLLFGFISLFEIEKMLASTLKPKVVHLVVSTMIFLASFGVYLGRYQRWNSWDIFKSPIGLFADISDRFLNPLAHSRTWGFTVLMGLLLVMMYWTLKLFRSGMTSGALSPLHSRASNYESGK